MIWDVDPILVKIGPVLIRYYGLFFVVALLGGYEFWKSQVIRGGGTAQDAENIFVPGVVTIILGARLGHVLFYDPVRYLSNPVEILYVWEGGLASHGAAFAIPILLYWYARRYNKSYLDVGDRFMMGVAWAASWVRVGNFMNSEIVGRVTDVPWGVKFLRHDGLAAEFVKPRHPSQIYEFLMGMAVLGILIWADKKLGEEKRPKGALTFLFLTLYFGIRFIVEFFKEYETISPDKSPFTMGQYLSLPFIIAGITGLYFVMKKRGAKA